MTERSRLLTDWLLLAGFCGFLFFFRLAKFGLVGADEPRYAQIAREMLVRHDWITPTLDGRPWLEKPALYYWQAMLAYHIFGVSDSAARLPSAIDATLMIFAVYYFLRRLRPGFELDGALMTASLAGVIGFARAASMDMPLSAAFTIALLAWFAWYESGSKRFLTLFYAFLGLGMLAKGPIAPVLAAIIIVVFVLSIRSTALLARTLWLPGITLFCAVAVPWYVAVQMRNPEFFRVFILEHNLARFRTNLYHHTEPLWYFVPVLLLALIPWAMFVVAAAMEAARAWWQRRAISSTESLNIFLVIWILIPVIFFSMSQSKLPGYILPALPAGALLVAEYARTRIAENARSDILLTSLHSIVASLSARPLAEQITKADNRRLPLAVLLTSRETEYGLQFYRNQTIARYELGQVPSGEHLVVAPEGLRRGVEKRAAGRRVTYLGSFAAQGLDYYWVGTAVSSGSR